jgi:hypothetical protein
MASNSLLPPSDKLNATIRTWGKGETVFRIHSAIYAPNVFNPSKIGNARFSPLFDDAGVVIPTLYAASTLDCALMETVFHDVPFAAGLKTLSKATHIAGQVYARLRLTRDLRLIDLSTIALRKMGVPRVHLIDTDASQYPDTRQWAIALHRQNPDAEGLLWTSRQDDTARALILFEDRMSGPALEVVEGPKSLRMPDGSVCMEVLELADRLGVLLM